MGQAGEEYNADAAALIRRHLAIGWATLLVFLSLGMVLEVFHGFKVRWYVDLNNATRRLMWTLAHAHGVLIGLIHISFAATVHFRPQAQQQRPLASTCLVLAGVLLPGGFPAGRTGDPPGRSGDRRISHADRRAPAVRSRRDHGAQSTEKVGHPMSSGQGC